MLITGTDFEDGAVNYSTCHFVERERYEQDKHIQIKNGSILITKDGTLGKVAYVQGLSMPATLNAGVFNVEINDKTLVDNRYLFQYLKAPFLMDYVDKKATGGTIKHLNQNILVDFPVVMPSKEEQEAIGRYFEQLDNLITLHQCKQNHKKEALMSYTLTKYEKETVLLYNQSHDPITISTYDPGLRRRLREFAARYPEMCWRVDKQKYPDYAEYEIKKDRVSIRLLPPMSEEKRRVASEKAKAAGLGTKGNA